MRATTFEFRNRFWIIGAIIWGGFWFYAIDHINAAAALGGWLATRLHWNEDFTIRLLFALGALLTILAALLRTWATSFLRTEVVHDASLHSEKLVADGPYRYVRNPLYLGTILLTLGMGLMASRAGYAFMLIGIVIFNLRLIRREEAELTASQGDSYLHYLKAVPCLIPSLTPRVAAGEGRSRWKQAVQGEGFIWGFAAAAVVFAITLKLVAFWIALAVAFALYFWMQAALKKQRQASSGDSSSGNTPGD
jgi:protein-S-isoprenylcysteine O-methyltransferase Ste14